MRSRLPTGRRTWTVTAAAGLLGLLVPAAPGVAQPHLAAVVPFTNVSRQPADDWIGAGIAETVAADVQKVGMAVVGWGGGDWYRAGGAPGDGAPGGAGAIAPAARAAWQDRGVSWIVDGTLQRLGDRLRITTRVVDAASGAVAFNTRVDGTWQDLFETQDRVAAAVADWLSSRSASPGPAPPEAALPEAARPGAARPESPLPAGAFVPASRTERTPGVPPPPGLAEAASVARVEAAAPAASAFAGRAGAGAAADPFSGNPAAVSGNGVTGALAFPRTGRPPGPRAADAPPPRRRGGGGFAPGPLARPTATVTRTAIPPDIDGRLDDSAWETATHITDFVQIAPVEGAPGSEATEVWMAFDSDHLYFAFHAHYADPGIMRVNRADREEIRGDDRMSVLFDPFLDQQRAYQFEVNGYGVQADSLVNADGSTGFSRSSGSSSATRGRGGGSRGRSSSSVSGQFGIRGDQSWNALFDTAGRIVDDGWVAEMRIPFKSLRYPSRAAGAGHRWGFQVTRIIRGKSEAQSWSPISRGVAGQITQFGQLEGLSDLSASRNLEFLPEVTGFRTGSLDTADGVFTDGDPTGAYGLGVKYGITPNLTADFTLNPDFSQIESDRPQVETNQRFALFYPEQRPFFLEGQEIFQTATPLTLVHTRTISDPLFGGKLTGKVGQSTLGVLVADDQMPGSLLEATDPRAGTSAQTVIGRARYDLYSESYVGAIMTAREFGEDYNRVAGVDGRFRLGRNHRVNFLAMGSDTADGDLGALSGPAIEANFSREGRNLTYSAAYSSIDPGFRTLTGFLPRVDLRQTSGNVGYRWWPESSILTWGPSVSYLRLYDHAGVLQDEQIQGTASFSFTNNISFTGMVNHDLERFQEVEFQKTGYGFFSGISSRLFSLFGGYNWGHGILYDAVDPYRGQSVSGNVNFRVQPTSRLLAELRTVFSSFVDPLNGAEVYDVKIFRGRTTYQFTDRLLLRHIMEHNTWDVTLGNNLLMTYRINAGTVLFLGYDDRFRSGMKIDDVLFPMMALQRTNRAFFGKVSYLFRY